MPSYSGVWNLVSVYQAVAQGNWPDPNATFAYVGAGRNSGVDTSAVTKINFDSGGVTSGFATLSAATTYLASFSSATRGFWAGGLNTANVIQYITLADGGSAVDFGDISTTTDYEQCGLSNSTRGVISGLKNTNAPVNVIEYITMSSASNSSDFGDLTVTRGSMGAAASTTRGLFSGGRNFGVYYGTTDYITIATTGNATNFGSLTVSRQATAGSSNSTRALLSGGFDNNYLNVIDYYTIATTGGATDFGDLISGVAYPASAANTVRSLTMGGSGNHSTGSNVIQYVTLATTGNATDFGDLSAPIFGAAACSSAHGGL